jgi:hypothetical protein
VGKFPEGGILFQEGIDFGVLVFGTVGGVRDHPTDDTSTGVAAISAIDCPVFIPQSGRFLLRHEFAADVVEGLLPVHLKPPY